MSLRRAWNGVRPQLLCGVVGSLFSSRARQTVRGLAMLRRSYEYVLVAAALEGTRDVDQPYYEAYVDALDILGARALLVAKAL